jgi:hypothetical protein
VGVFGDAWDQESSVCVIEVRKELLGKERLEEGEGGGERRRERKGFCLSLFL